MVQLLQAAGAAASVAHYPNRDIQILGNDLVLPEMVTKVTGLKYADEQLIQLAETFPGHEMVSLLATEGFVLVPRPPISLSAYAVYCMCEAGNFGVTARYERYKYMRNTPTGAASWFKLRKEVPAATRRKSMADGRCTLSSDEYVPNVADVAYALTLFKLLGRLLYEEVYALTATEYTPGCLVGVGMQKGHLSFLPMWKEEKLRNFGLAVAKR